MTLTKMVNGVSVEMSADEEAALLADQRAQTVALAAVVPALVSMAQAQIALLRAGLLDQVQAAIAAAPDPDGAELRIWWIKATICERANRFVISLGHKLGLTDAQIDDLFRNAASVV